MPTSASGWVGLITTIIIGVFSLIALFDRTVAARRKEKDALDESLISTLKATISELTNKIEKMDLAQKENSATINRLLGENNIMKTLLQGRDEQTVLANKAAIETNKIIVHLAKTFDDFLKNQTKHE